MVDFSKEKFDYSHELWLKMQKGEIDPNLYGSPGKGSGFASIKVCHDLASLLGEEYTTYHYAPLLEYAITNNNQLTLEAMELLNRISELMKTLNTENLSQLREIYHQNPQIQLTRLFDPKKKHKRHANHKS